jgi:hypothetical protein
LESYPKGRRVVITKVSLLLTSAIPVANKPFRYTPLGFPILPFELPSTPTNPTINPIVSFEQDLEAILRHQIDCYRDDNEMLCVWDEDLSHLLSQCLWGCEMAKLMRGSGVNGASSDGYAGMEFHEGVKGAIPEGHTFKVRRKLGGLLPGY